MSSRETQPPRADSLSRKLEDNLERIRSGVGNSFDVKFRPFYKRSSDVEGYEGAVVFADGLADSRPVLQAILGWHPDERGNGRGADDYLAYLRESVLSDGSITELESFEPLFVMLLSGHSIVLLDGAERALAVDTIHLNARPVEEPNVQSVVRGPREGFSEVLNWNTSMLRRKIKSPNLWIESRVIGAETRTTVAVAYVKGIASEDVVREVQARLDRIEIDAILESNYIEEYIPGQAAYPVPDRLQHRAARRCARNCWKGGSPFWWTERPSC